jgi:hypothetical protein
MLKIVRRKNPPRKFVLSTLIQKDAAGKQIHRLRERKGSAPAFTELFSPVVTKAADTNV